MNKLTVLFCSMAVAGVAGPGSLNLDQALELARQTSPELRAARLHTQAAEKSVDAAGLRKNPKLIFEAEGLGWDNDLFSEGEYTLGLKQEFQRRGKRRNARSTARKSREAARWAVQEKELELAAMVRQAFVELMAQQEIGTVRVEQEQLGRAFVEVAKRRRDAGGGSELAVVQAELALEETLLLQTCCFGDLAAAQEKLAALIGVPRSELGELVAPYYELDPVDGLLVDDSLPTLQRLAAQIDQVRGEAQQAKAKDAANITLDAGLRHEAMGDINTFVFGASMPLAFSRRGRAEQAVLLLRADALQAEQAEVRRQLQADLATTVALYKGAKVEVEMTHNNLMPKAEQAYVLSRAGYDAGRFSWFELITAQQHLAAIRIRYIEALKDAHLARAELSKFMQEGS